MLRYLRLHCNSRAGADIGALSTPQAEIGIEDRPRGVLLSFSCGRCTAHAKVLYGTSKSGEEVTFEVRQNDQAVCFRYVSCNLHGLKVPSVYRNFGEVLALQSIGYDHRRTHNRIVEAVLNGSHHMVRGVGPASSVQSVGIGHERHGSQGFSAYPRPV